MIRRLIESPRFLDQVKYVYGAAVLITVALGGFMLWTGATGFLEAVRADRAVQARKAEYAKLSAQATELSSRQFGLYNRRATGVEAFAVQMSAMAKAHSVSIEALSPEGAEGVLDVKYDGTNLGQWGQDLVNVRGRGQFDQVVQVLSELSSRVGPQRLESYSLQSIDGGDSGVVEFTITVTVYQRKERAA